MEETAPSEARWSWRDVALAWLAGLVASFIAFATAGFDPSTFFLLAVVLPVQSLATLATLVLLSRWKGRGSLAADLGLWARASDAAGLLLGVGLQVAIVLVLTPVAVWLGVEESPQQLARLIDELDGWAALALVMASVGVLGPIAEECLFRGALLRALRPRLGDRWAIGVSALAFGAVHLIDPGTVIAVPAFILMGLFFGWLVVRDGRLGRALFAHIGVNLSAVLASFAVGP